MWDCSQPFKLKSITKSYGYVVWKRSDLSSHILIKPTYSDKIVKLDYGLFHNKGTKERILNALKEIEFINCEVIIIDDGSTDGTRELLKEKYENLVDKVIYHKTNFGKGAAVRSGLKYVTGEIILIQDADLEYNPSDYEILLDPFLKEKADVVYGSRFIGKKRRVI